MQRQFRPRALRRRAHAVCALAEGQVWRPSAHAGIRHTVAQLAGSGCASLARRAVGGCRRHDPGLVSKRGQAAVCRSRGAPQHQPPRRVHAAVQNVHGLGGGPRPRRSGFSKALDGRVYSGALPLTRCPDDYVEARAKVHVPQPAGVGSVLGAPLQVAALVGVSRVYI